MDFPNIDPVAIQIGPLKIHWYGITYLIGFAAVWWLGRRRARMSQGLWNDDKISDMVFYGALGAVLGGRIGYTLFYGMGNFLNDPLMIFRVWEGGMSFHGGFLGVLVAMVLFARKYNKRFFDVMDFLAPLTPIGLGAVRVSNFINGELWGRTTDVPWGMVFPNSGPLPRHPSQLYEAFLEGVVLFLILWFYSSKPRPRMAVSGVFSLGYGLFRFSVEFVREPDAHLSFIAFDWLTMGQLLSTPMILLGIGLLIWAYKHPSYPTVESENIITENDTQDGQQHESNKKKKGKRKK